MTAVVAGPCLIAFAPLGAIPKRKLARVVKLFFKPDDLAIAELGMQPRSCELPVPHDRLRRDCQHLGGLFHAQAAKEPQLDNACLAWVIPSQGIECVFEGDQFPRPVAAEVRKFIEIDPIRSSASFGCNAAAGAVEQDVPHDLC